VSVAREEALNSHFASFVSQGLNIAFATTVGNALMAEFCCQHPKIDHARIVDFGASQTTAGCLIEGQPRYLTTLSLGGESLIEALLEVTGSNEFERMEQQLFSENLFVNERYGPALQKALGRWLRALVEQFSDWDDTSSTIDKSVLPVFLYGGFSTMPGLLAALNAISDSGFVFKLGAAEGSSPLQAMARPLSGAVRMAANQSRFRSSILPNALTQIRLRRKRLNQVRIGSMVVFSVLLLALLFGSLERARLANSLDEKKQQIEIAAAAAMKTASTLQERDRIGQQIAPIVDRWVRSIEVVETLRLLQLVRDEFDFGLQSFSNHRSFSAETRSTNSSGTRHSGRTIASSSDALPEVTRAPGFMTFVVEIVIEGDPAAQLNKLSEIVLRLRQEPFFENVDRLVRFESTKVDRDNTSGVYALALTLNGRSIQPH
jgi:hypothetical protein